MIDYIYIILTLLSTIAAILAWIAKLRWSKEYSKAKDEVIKAKDAEINILRQQIKNLESLNPMKLREYFDSVKLQLEEYNDSLHRDLNAAKKEIKNRDIQINTLKVEGETNQLIINKIESERKKFDEAKTLLEKEIKQLRIKQNSEINNKFFISHFDEQLLLKSILVLDNLDKINEWRSNVDKYTSGNIRNQILLYKNFFLEFCPYLVTEDKQNTNKYLKQIVDKGKKQEDHE